MKASNEPNRPGALVISLDFELHWGVRDHVDRHDPLYRRLPEARRAVHDLTALFAARNIRATWATVGFLFASTRQELDAHLPNERPTYERPDLDPYVETIGLDEEQDPEHLAGSLVELIATTAGQEVGSHTFSHYYCLDPGQEESMFRADLTAAQSIAALARPGADESGPAPQSVESGLHRRCVGSRIPLHSRPPTHLGLRGPAEWGRPWPATPRRQTGRRVHRAVAPAYDGMERCPRSIRTVQHTGQRIHAPIRSQPEGPRAAPTGATAVGSASGGAARAHLPSVVASPQLLPAPDGEHLCSRGRSR